MSLYDFDKFGSKDLSVANILKKVSEVILWRHYLGTDFKLGATMHAPYREDPTPSFSVFYSQRLNKILAKDFGGSGFVGDIFDYVRLIYNLDFYSALVKVNLDFDLGLLYNKEKVYNVTIEKISYTRHEKKRLDMFEERIKAQSNVIQISARIYNDGDLEYWSSFGITQKTLKLYNVYAVDNLYLNKEIVYQHDLANPCYAYYFPNSKHFKCYFPLATERRFLGNIDNFQDIQGYYQCNVKEQRDDKLLILTKSMKDCMTLREFGLDAMAIHGETHKFHIDFIRHIKKYYPRIISIYDRDKSGVRGAKYLWKEHGIMPYFIPKTYKIKDISDMYKYCGRDKVSDFLNNITKLKLNIKNYGNSA